MTERDLHDMGGNIGPASMANPRSDDDSAGDYAESISATVGTDEANPSVAGSDESGSAATPPVATTHGDYLSIDEVDNLGRGADGETSARLQQVRDGEL